MPVPTRRHLTKPTSTNMYTYQHKLRVRYAETDQMGYVYYGNYAMYYEVARVEALRNLGMSYRGLEQDGVMMPVLENWSKFLRPARYDEELTVKVMVPKLPANRMYFEYEVYNESGELINIGKTTLVFVDMKTGKPCHPPEKMLKLMGKYFMNG